jgi:transcriptional regulator with XRE-family HTH domain
MKQHDREEPMKLVEVRRTRLLSTRALERESGVSAKTINAIERGHTTPALATIKKLSEALGVDPLEVDEFREAIMGEETALASV